MSNQPVVSCLPVSANKMSKAKKVLDEARETKNREIDLVDRNISTFEELPGLREYSVDVGHISCGQTRVALFW